MGPHSGQWAPQAAIDALAAILDADLAHRAAKGISASVDGVGQDVVDRVGAGTSSS